MGKELKHLYKDLDHEDSESAFQSYYRLHHLQCELAQYKPKIDYDIESNH